MVDGARTRRVHGALRAVAGYGVALLALVTLVFLLPRAMPGDPLAVLSDPDSGAFLVDDAARQRLESYYGLDRPVLVQFGAYLSGIVQGDLGFSISRSAPVVDLVRAHLPWTLLLTGTALAISAAVSFRAGVMAAWRRGSVGDRVTVAGLTGLDAVPDYALASVLLIGLGVLVPVFPLYGARTPFAEYGSWVGEMLDVARHLALPLTALTLGLLGTKFLLVRNTVVGVLGADFMVAARAKGLPEKVQKRRHAGRNAVLPFLTLIGIHTGMAVGSAIFVESVFAYPGMGSLILGAVEARDYPLLEGVFLVLAATVLTANLVVELLYVRFDPQVGSSR